MSIFPQNLQNIFLFIKGRRFNRNFKAQQKKVMSGKLKVLISALLIWQLCSCSYLKEEDSNQLLLSQNVIPNPIILKETAAFLDDQERHKDYAVNLYVDKRDRDNYRITFKAYVEKEVKSHNSIMYFMLNGNRVNVFSGLEDFFQAPQSTPVNKLPKKTHYKAKSLVILKDTSYLVEGVGIPFTLPQLKPTINYEAPNPIREDR